MRLKYLYLIQILFTILNSHYSLAVSHIGMKGLGVIPGNSLNEGYVDGIEKLNIKWYYNWGVYPEKGMPKGIEYVPMLGNLRALNKTNDVIKYPNILLFNEPDPISTKSKVDIISPSQAASHYNSVSDKLKNINIISPAPRNPWNNWLNSFLAQTKATQDIDTIAMHWYGAPNIEKFKKDVKFIHSKYKKNIWITEFATSIPCDDTSPSNQKKVYNFLKEAIEFINTQSYIVRYSWYSPNNGKANSCALRYNSLIDLDGKLTSLGMLYSHY